MLTAQRPAPVLPVPRTATFTLQQPNLPRPRPEHLAHPDSPVGRAVHRTGVRAGAGSAMRPTDRAAVTADVLAADLHAAMATLAAGAQLGDREADLLPYLAKALVATGWVTP